MSQLRFFGLIFTLVLIFHGRRAESANLDNGQDQDPTASQNSFSIEIPLGSGNVIQNDNQVASTVQRRMSLEDFFMNRNQQEQPAAQQQEPAVQFNVQQPDPNSLLLVRDTQFPSPTGGLISRMILARRMLRMRRIARRLSILPRIFGFGLRQALQRSTVANTSPLSLFSNRIGEAYDPRDYVFGNKGFSYQDNLTNTQQRDANNQDQTVQQTRGYAVGADPYYGGVTNSNYDDSLDDSRNLDSDELNELKKQEEILNSLTDEQQILLLQQLQNYQQQLNQLQDQLNQQQHIHQVQGQLNNQNNNNQNLQNYQNQRQVIDFNPIQQQQQLQQQQQIHSPVQSQQNLQNAPIEQNEFYKSQTLNNNQLEQLEQLRQLQAQLAQEQQIQQQLQQQLQQLQLNQQAQNLKHQQNLASLEKENNQVQTVQQSSSNSAGDRTEASQFTSPIGIGGSAGIGNTIGAGINVAIKPPSVDVQVTKPVGGAIKPLPPLVNPIAPKPVPAAPAIEPLIPIGILPKPILNLKGRMFLGAELGKGVGVQAGVGR